MDVEGCFPSSSWKCLFCANQSVGPFGFALSGLILKIDGNYATQIVHLDYKMSRKICLVRVMQPLHAVSLFLAQVSTVWHRRISCCNDYSLHVFQGPL